MVPELLFQSISANMLLLTYHSGLYEQQDPDQPDCNLRGKFYTDEDGKYAFYCLRPTPYPVRKPRQGYFIQKLIFHRSLEMVQLASFLIYLTGIIFDQGTYILSYAA